MRKGSSITSIDLAKAAAAAIDDMKGLDTIIIDVSNLLFITDLFVIATGTSNRQVRSIADEVHTQLKEKHQRMSLRSEGADEAEWILLDYGEIVVHVFQAATRAFYDLERLWGDAPRIPFEPATQGTSDQL